MRIQAEGLLRASEDQQAAEGGANAEEMAKLTHGELLAMVTQEMIDLEACGALMPLEMSPESAFVVVAMCQLGLRHPAFHGSRFADLARAFVKYVEVKFRCHAPAVAEAIRRGNDPQYDVSSQHVQPFPDDDPPFDACQCSACLTLRKKTKV